MIARARDAHEWRSVGAGRQPSSNAILGSIPDKSLAALVPLLEEATLPQHAVLFRSFTPTAYVYFPVSAVVSLTNSLADGQKAQTATVGREGMVGPYVALETNVASLDAVVQIAGPIWRLPIQPFQELVVASPAFRRLLLRYTEAFFTDASHTATCNALHRVNQRCARWLLAARDRVGNNRLRLSSQSLAQTLGAHQEGVTVAMRALQDEKIIQGHRGYLDVLDLAGLMQSSCSCYAHSKARFAHVTGAFT